MFKTDVKIYDKLPIEAGRIRKEVFMDEQGFREEFDDIDFYAKHMVVFEGGFPIAVCRFFYDGKRGGYIIGRIAVVKKQRGKNIGADLLKEAEKAIKDMGGKRIFIHAQKQAEGFYEKQGYVNNGEADFEEGCPHIWMYKDIKQSSGSLLG